MAALIQAKDWSKTPLGPRDQWPESLRVAVGICLGSRFPMFLWWGPDLINFYNDAYIPILGRRHPDALGGSAPDLWREVWPVIGPQVEAVMRRGEASWHQRVQLMVERNGYPEEAYFTWSHSAVPGEGGQVGGVLCVVMEETAAVLGELERARLVAERARADEQSRTILESITDAFFAVDEAWRFTYANAQAERVLERPPGDLLGKVLWDEYPGLVGSEFERIYRRAATQRIPGSVTAFYPDHGRWYEVHAYPAPDGGVSIYFRNVSDQKQAEEQLRRSHDTFYNLIQNNPFGVYVVDADFRLAEVSLGAQKVFAGIQPLLGRDFSEVLRAVWAEPFATEAIGRFRRTLETGEPYSSPSTIEQRQGTAEIESYDWRIERVMLPDGRHGVVCYFYDLSERLRLEAEVRASEARRSTALAIAHLGTFEVDARTSTLALDDRSREIFGFGPGEGTRSEEVFARIDPVDRPRVLAEGQASRRNLSRLETEYRVNLPDGAVRYVASINDVIAGPDGQAERIFGVWADVTERRRAEEALLELAERFERQWRLFERIASTTLDFIYVFDLEGRFLYANRRLLEVWGRTFEDAVGKSLYELGYPDWHMAELRQVIETKQPIRGEVPFTGGSGISGFYEYIFTPVLDRKGEVEVIAGTTRDVTERKKAEEERQRLSAERDQQLRTFDTVLATLQEFVYLLDHDGRFTYANKPLLDLWRRTPAEAFGKSFAELGYPPELVALHASQLAEVIRTGKPVRGENAFTDAAGRTGHFEYIFVPLFAADGSVEAVGGASRDVTEQRRQAAAREELLASERAARAEAERQSRIKDEFLATLSHELRTPLNAILGWSQVLRSRQTGSAEDIQRGLETIERNARAQTRIIEDLLDMSRIVSGKIRLDVQRVDLASVIEAAVGTVRHAADAKGVRLLLVLDPAAGPVAGDPARLQQVFWNLLSNSVKHSQRGGRVQVLLERVNSHLEVSVIDDGEGISPEFLPLVFDRFRQADSTTTRRHGGLGLGLSIVKQLVELHGGTVRAKSPGVGKGATFTVMLPLTPVHHDPAPVGERRHPRADVDASVFPEACVKLTGVRVLVVDDELDARSLVQRLLEDCEAVVLTAASAPEALSLLLQEKPDVLVSDIGMPGEDGYSLIRKVRALESDAGGEVPAVALTAYARSEDRTRAMLAGFQTHVAKPVEPVELVATVASLARRTGRD
jgi:hypothetical protein